MSNNEVFNTFGIRLDNHLSQVADTFKWIWFHGWEAGQQYAANNQKQSKLQEKIETLEGQLADITAKYDAQVKVTENYIDLWNKSEKDIKYFRDLSKYWFEQAR